MVKITIELDDLPRTSEPAAGKVEPPAPSDLAARAAQIGAIDGGAAPAAPPQGSGPSPIMAIAGQETPAGSTSDAMSAGAAPGGPPPAVAEVVVEQDPDAPSTPDQEGRHMGEILPISGLVIGGLLGLLRPSLAPTGRRRARRPAWCARDVSDRRARDVLGVD